MALFDEMENQFANIDAIGFLRVGASITIGNYLLPQYITDFQKIYPHMGIKMMIDNSNKIQEAVLANNIDVGLVEGQVDNSYIVEKPFRDDKLVFICSEGHKFSSQEKIYLEDFRHENLLSREKGSAGREIFDNVMSLYGIECKPFLESISTQAIIRAVKANLGISVLPYLLVEEAIESGEVIQFQVEEIKMERKFSVIYHQNKYLTRSAEDFIQLCK